MSRNLMTNPTCRFLDILSLIQEILMRLWCKTSQNIWPLFSKYLPLHHLTPEWWNGRHEGLKIPWPLRLYEFESRFRHLPSVGFPAGGIFCALIFSAKALRQSILSLLYFPKNKRRCCKNKFCNISLMKEEWYVAHWGERHC